MNEKDKLILSYLDGGITNVEIIELLIAEREKSKRYRNGIKSVISKFNQDEHREGMNLLIKALEESNE